MAAGNSGSSSSAAFLDKAKRSSNWTEVETRALIRIWEEYLSDLRTAKRNAKVYERIAEEFFEATGKNRDKDQIRTKVTNLTFQYRKLKATCATSTSYWPYYEALHRMLSQFPGHDETNTTEDLPELLSTTRSEAPSPSPPPPLEQPTFSSTSDILLSEASSYESNLMENSSSFHCSQAQPRKRKKVSKVDLDKKRLRLMETMLEEQKKISAAVEETKREVRRILNQQTFLQNQSVQLQRHMVHLLETLVSQHTPKRAATL
uniref:Myb/SANT DNA binding domain containing 1 n=1 Tax=Callorhinchus milii TaxID=7868 RepID=A0A4W3I5J9_CALMI